MKIARIAIASVLLFACGEDPDALLGRRNGAPDPGAPGSADGTQTPVELQCTDKPQGRSYALFDGSKLEEGRVNENVGVNRARLKPYKVMAAEYQRVLGAVPASLAGAAGSFDEPPARWFAEAQYSGVSLNAIFDISFEGCLAFTATPADYAAAPTAASADAQCKALMRKAWSRSPSPAEVQGCVDLATTKLQAEKNPRRQWAYVCASVLSAGQFLTF